jgi:hypothetical protein
LVAHVDAFSRGFSLRSGCDLRPMTVVWTWLGGQSDEDIQPLSTADAAEVFRECVTIAHRAGLPVGPEWADEPLILWPNDALLRVIRSTYPVVE